MNKKSAGILLTFICLISFTSVGQLQTSSKSVPPSSGEPVGAFIGNWKGRLQWIVAGKPTQEFTMQLRIQPADTAGQYTWQIIYGDDNKDNRPYILKPVDTAKGHWVVDERDGIILDSYLHGNCMHGAFSVMGNTIVDNYCVETDTAGHYRMKVEFFSIKLDDKKQSGKGTEDVPTVLSYRVASYQTGILTKQE
jgi:hypothetical protein